MQLGRIVKSVRAFAHALSTVPAAVPELAPVTRVRPKLGIALGGGFARGIAHIGVLKVIEEERIPIDFVAGTSVGSLIGAGYCSGISAKELEEIAHLVRFRDFARWTLSRWGFCTNDRMESFLGRVVKCKTFEELKIPLAVTATDFFTGDPVVLNRGSIIPTVRASCAYPGMFLPVEIDGRMLIDGMLAHAVPTTPLRTMGADRVLGIYLSAHWVRIDGPRHLFDVIGQCFSIAQARMSEQWKKDADLVIEPKIDGFSYDAFDRAAELIAAGETAMREALPEVRAWLETPEPQRVKIAGAPTVSRVADARVSPA
jgi:NTE family protein